MLAFRVTWFRASELRKDVEQQLAHGGILVRVDATPAMQLHEPVALDLVLPDGTTVSGAGTILHLLPGHGVAVSVGAEQIAGVWRSLISQGKDLDGAPTARHQLVVGAGVARTSVPGTRTSQVMDPRASQVVDPRASRPGTPSDATGPSARLDAGRVDQLSTADKIKMALHGDKDARAAILRDRNVSLHQYVLKNPQLRQEEILGIARNPQSSPELLRHVAEKREWMSQADIATALARNPKTPQEIALRAIEAVPMDALRMMAKGAGVLPHVSAAARKRVLG